MRKKAGKVKLGEEQVRRRCLVGTHKMKRVDI